MNKTLWGKDKNGNDIHTYEIKNTKGMMAKVMDFGATVLELHVLDANGQDLDVVLGYKNLEDYFTNNTYFGCCVVPFANRIGNAKFTLNGKEYAVDVNDNENNLHSGFNPICRRMWQLIEDGENSITFQYDMEDMDSGFPGNMSMKVTYTLTEDNEFKIDYWAKSDKDTLFNPTNHSYFNLGGHDSENAMDQLVWIDADSFTETDPHSIPNGNLIKVAGTPLDFTKEKALAPEIDDEYEQLKWAAGYDHNFVLNGKEGEIKLAATMRDANSKIKMEVYTDLPGMQLYAGNYIPDKELVGKTGEKYARRSGVCFESQYFPNAINIPSFSQPVIKAGEEKETSTLYKFLIS
ncbi:MAG: galactose mutarotase [Lachnospiraceae bacterium]|nr:galactose mutarotase [Lachnospiraceae bacterium]